MNAETDKVQLPVTPEKITYTHDSNNDTVTVSGLGEVTILQAPSALELSWDCHFPARPHQGSIPSPLAPQDYVDKINAWRATNKPIHFLVTGTKINGYFSIESFSYHEDGGDPDTLYYSIKVKAYQDVTVRKLDNVPTISIGQARGSGGAGGQSGKVKTKGSRLKLFKKASKSSKVIAKMPNKSKLTILSASGSWYQVIYIKKNKTGYCKASKVKLT